MKRLICALLAVLMLAAIPLCAFAEEGAAAPAEAEDETQEDEAVTEPKETVEEEAAEATEETAAEEAPAGDAEEAPGMTEEALPEDAASRDYTTGTPWPDCDLDGVAGKLPAAEAKDDFALFVNRDAILDLKIPEGRPYAGTIMDTALQNNEDLKNMFLGDAPEGHDAKLAYELFRLMMDWDSRNALGVEPLKEMTDAVEGLDSIDALNAYYFDVPYEDQFPSVWSAGSTTSLDDSTRKILAVDECGLLLGDSAEYETLTDYGAMKKAAYAEFSRRMLMKLGYSEEEALQKFENCLAFESLVAPVIYTNEEQGSADYLTRINNTVSREALQEAQGKLPILAELESLGFPEAENYLVTNPEYLTRINEVYTDENLPLIRDYMIVHGVLKMAGNLDRECYEWANDCSNAISGATGILPDETAFSSAVSGTLQWPVARLYTETYLKAEDKERIAGMVDQILEAYQGILKEADFLSEATREKALEKLAAIDARVLYPDSWEKYDCAELNFDGPEAGGTLLEAMKAITRYEVAKEVREYSEPVDKEKWHSTPQTVNCFYNPQENSVTILGAFARGGVYNSGMSDEELYAKLGTVIGHEISHAFDRQGAQFDKDGNMSMWWTEEDYKKFQERNAALEAYYNAMHPWEGQNFYGAIMTGEACADMAGVKVMLRLAAEKEGFDYDAFFRAYANIWLTKDTLQMAYRRINDAHPMAYLRINATLQQFDEFMDCYGVQEGDGMYLAPEERVAIW